MTYLGYLQQLITHHRPPRTARAWKVLLLKSTVTLPLMKSTYQARSGVLGALEDDQ